MSSKICKDCGKEKDISEFPIHNKKLGTYRCKCSECYSAYRRLNRINNIEQYKETNKKSYTKNKKSIISKVCLYQNNNKDKVKKWAKKHKEKSRKNFIDFKSKLFCSECGENHISCLEFHHKNPKEKEYAVSKLYNSPIKLKKEINKCIVLCSNCHRKLHYNIKTTVK
jgi:hypothetical protein